TKEFVKLYNKTNDLKQVMRAFTNREGQLVLSWSVIDREIRRKKTKHGSALSYNPKEQITAWEPSPGEYQKFRTTVWDIPRRGTWGVHQPTYRGNWAPQVPRALMELYTRQGDLVLDPFMGGGTTLIEAWSLGRHAIGYDISEMAVAMTRARLSEM